jgi:hypothetical protein
MEENSETALRNSVIEQGNQGWVYYKELDPIPENLLGLNVCTLDFKVHPRYVLGELQEDRAFHELIRNPKLIKEDFIIKREEIPIFLSDLENATGGKGTFRHLTVNTPVIKDTKWDLKFLNLYLSPLNDGFIVCNRISRAIRWREIIPNINQKDLGFYNSKKE